MKCPVCKNPDLVMADRQGIEIDYCPNCRGVWLDRGELDKIIERTSSSVGTDQRNSAQRYPDTERHKERRDYENDYNRKKKKRGILGDIFDF